MFNDHPSQPRFGNAKELLRRRNDANTIVCESAGKTLQQDIENAKIVIAGGYGIRSRENFELLYRLAELVGGKVGATRAAVDAGFCDSALMIGITGITIHPELYIAVGISGQSQHLAGVKDAKYIISINRDTTAPINQIAERVIIGDAHTEVMRLIEQFSSNNTTTENLYEQLLRG